MVFRLDLKVTARRSKMPPPGTHTRTHARTGGQTTRKHIASAALTMGDRYVEYFTPMSRKPSETEPMLNVNEKS